MSIHLLALETATDHCSVALYHDQKITDYAQIAAQRPSTFILPMIEQLLLEANLPREKLTAIAFGCGPGSFTGVRLAMSIAQTIAFALNIPLIPISTLRALAQQAWRLHQKKQVLAALDARLKQIYWGGYQLAENNIMTLYHEERVDDPQALATSISLPTTEWIGIGSGWDQYHQSLPAVQWLAECYPQAYDIALLGYHDYLQGKTMPPLSVQPTYLRNQVARTLEQQRKKSV